MIDPLPSDIFCADEVLNNTYKIEGVLGRGGTGEVYLARNQVTGRVVAIKALNAQFSGNSDYVELMKREEEMRSIIHDAVVRYTECSRTDNGHVVLVMDFVNGESLNDVMQHRRLDPKELLIIAHRVAEGLVVTHAGGIVHRDLSPDNIILRDGNPEAATIIDFGIAKDTASGARTIVGNQFAGKYEYASPEQLDGQAEPRSDFYSLGAALLAAYLGDIPFPGATPGEIVRRKQSPLDTSSVPDPLKSLIDWLSAPDPNDRPATATDIVDRIDETLRPDRSSNRSTPAKASSKKSRRGWWLVLPLALGVAGGLAYLVGILDPLLPQPLPVVSPYTLSAGQTEDGVFSVEGYAPTKDAALKLAGALSAVVGAEVLPDSLTLADGFPSDDWVDDVAMLTSFTSGLASWTLSVQDTNANLVGLAADITSRDRIVRSVSDWSSASGFGVSTDILAGPKDLSVQSVQSMLDSLATCGPLYQRAAADSSYPLPSIIDIAGDFASGADAATIKDAIRSVIGDREVKIEANVLNSQLCAILSVLPDAPANAISIWLGDGETGQANLTGAYHVGENPIAEIHAPANMIGGSLWVMVIDSAGLVFHVLPHINRPTGRLDDLGVEEGGFRRIPVLYSIKDFQEDNTRIAFRISEEDFGKSQIIAILSRTPLFDTRRPRDESVESLAKALSERLTGREDDIIGVATRVIDARP
ncbi:MAG: serine/threonine-protein kinase [Paracoccaceae bacterium]